MPGTVRVGLSGWRYRDWEGRFYPKGLSGEQYLAFIAERFDTVEVNRSFYSLLRPAVYRSWYRAVPDDFVFAVKGSRYITHQKKLRDPEAPLGNFLASGVLALEEKLGPLLWQLPGTWRFDPERVGAFLDLLPADFSAAAEVAKGHDDRVEDPAIPDGGREPIRHVLEVRHPSALSPDLVAMAREREVALAFSHGSSWPYTEELTTDLVYLRLHGPRELYSSRYEPDELAGWAARIEAWRRGDQPDDAARITELAPPRAGSRDVYVYFDNDVEAHAPANAEELRRQLEEGEHRSP